MTMKETMVCPITNPLTSHTIQRARAYVWARTGGTWLAVYEAGLGRELTDDEVVFAYLVAQVPPRTTDAAQ